MGKWRFSATEGGESPPSRPECFTPEGSVPCIHWIGGEGLQK
jgi:hypothetical protein